MNIKSILYLVLTIVGMSVITRVSINYTSKILKDRDIYKKGSHIVYTLSDSNVLGLVDETSNIEVDFSSNTGSISPLIFGGSQVPYNEHQDAWDQIKIAGVTAVRKDFFPEYTIPNNITLEDYTSNKDNIQEPSNWKTNNILATKNNYHEAKLRNLKVIGILAYSPPWLTYSGTQYGVPKNWEVYEDIVKKLYRIYRPDLDYLEIWNEPTYSRFLDPAGSGLSREEAYVQIFLHAVNAVREVDQEINDGRRIKIGGPVSHESNNIFLASYFLQNQEVKNQLDFISFHHYGKSAPDWQIWKNLLNNNNLQYLPIFLTEWNYSPDVTKYHPTLIDNQAISYTSSMFINFMQNHVYAANYYSLFPLQVNKPGNGHGYLAFYEWNDNKASLLPQAKSWNLFSTSLNLGKGSGSTFKTDSHNIDSLGFQNVDRKKGIVLANDSSEVKTITVTLRNIGQYSNIELEAFEASKDNDGRTKILTKLPVKNSSVTYKIIAPAYSSIGVLISPTDPVSSIIDQLLRKLYLY